MTLDACIAHAISSDLDIMEALPEVHRIPLEEIEPYVEQYVVKVQSALRAVINDSGEPYLRSQDAAGLCAMCLESGVGIPPRMLLRMCQTIMNLSKLDATFILDTEDGKSLYYVRMQLA